MPNQIAFYPQTTGGTGGLTLISKQVVSSAVAAVTFSAIPQAFTNLKIVGNFNITGGSLLAVAFNGSTSTYSFGLSYANVNTPAALSGTNTVGCVVAANVGSIVIQVPFYTASPLGINVTGTFSSSSASNGASGGCLASATSVTSVTLQDVGGIATFATGSTFALYAY